MFVHSIKSAVRLAAAVASIGLAGVSSAAVWINQGYSRPIDPATNLPVPLANLTDFHMDFTVRGSKPAGQGNPVALTVPNRINGGNARRDAVAGDPQFMPAAVAPLVITPGVPAGGVRTDTVAMNWDRRNNPIVIGASGYLKFGGQFVTDNAQVTITSARWTTSVGGLPSVAAPTRATWDFTVPKNRGNGFSFSYTDEEGPMTLTGPDGQGPLVFESRPDPLTLDQLDPNQALGGTGFIPDGATINGIPVSPNQSLYSLGSGDTITFTYSGVIDPAVTIQGLQSYATGDFAAFAVQSSEVVPLPGALCGGLGLMFFGGVMRLARRRPQA